jgi:hypothetical protein
VGSLRLSLALAKRRGTPVAQLLFDSLVDAPDGAPYLGTSKYLDSDAPEKPKGKDSSDPVAGLGQDTAPTVFGVGWLSAHDR